MNSPLANGGPGLQPRPEPTENSSSTPRLKLALYPDTILRRICEPVSLFDSTLRDLADEMLSLMRHHRAYSLSAPQVGRRDRLIVCDLDDHPLALTNLEVKDTTEPRDSVEGCLSLPGVQVYLRRPERIRITGYDMHGQRRSFGATGLWARVIQHELDHLNGVLICDYQHPEGGRCSHCALELPAVLVEERKHKSRPREGCRHQTISQKDDL